MLLTGASGGFGHYFVEFAAAIGSQVTALTGSPARGERLTALGAAEIVHSCEDFAPPFDVVVESVGGDVFKTAWLALSPTGLLFWIGQASGIPVTLDFSWRVGPGINPTIRRFSYWPGERPDGVDLATLVRLTATGRLHPEIGDTADWRDTVDMLRRLRERRVRGNAVLTVTSA